MGGQRKRKSIFVTVGTTLFDALVGGVTTETALDWMRANGYTHLVIQYGKGKKPQLENGGNPAGRITVECYDYKPSLAFDMDDAELIISHAGAGTVMECLQLKDTRLVVVINTILMDNHQTELANAMGSRNHLFVVNDPHLLNEKQTWDAIRKFVPTPKNPGDDDDFARLLNGFVFDGSDGKNKSS